MIHDDPKELTYPQAPKIMPWPKAYFERVREMTDRELKLRATHLQEEKFRRIDERTKILREIPNMKKRKKAKANAQDL